MADPVVVESWHLPRALSDEALQLLTSLPMEEIERRLRMNEPTGHERPTDEELLRTYGLAKRDHDHEGPIDDWPKRAERAAVVAGLRAVLARWGAADGEVAELPPRPPLIKPPAHLALERYGITWDGSPDKPLLTRMVDGYWTPWHVAADLLERQAASLPVARLPEDAQVIEPVNRAILVPIPTPIPVSERLPEKAEMTDDDEVWVEYPGGEYPLGDTGDYDWEPHKWILSPIEKFTIRENRRWLPAHALPLPEVE